MKKIVMVSIIIIVFAAAVYIFETGEKDSSVVPDKAPSHVKG